MFVLNRFNVSNKNVHLIKQKDKSNFCEGLAKYLNIQTQQTRPIISKMFDLM